MFKGWRHTNVDVSDATILFSICKNVYWSCSLVLFKHKTLWSVHGYIFIVGMSSHSLPFWLPTFVCHPRALGCWAALLLGRCSSSPCSASELHRDVHITHLCAQALISSVFRFAFGWTCSRTRFRLADCGWHRCRLYFDRSLTCGYIFFLRRGNLYLYRSSDLDLRIYLLSETR